MGLIGRALVHLCCAGNPERLTGMRLRFTAPVVPGEIIRTEVWRGAAAIRFRASVPARSVVAADGRLADLDSFAAEPELADICAQNDHMSRVGRPNAARGGTESVSKWRFGWVRTATQ